MLQIPGDLSFGFRTFQIGPGKFPGAFDLVLGQEKFASLLDVLATIPEIPFETFQGPVRVSRITTESSKPASMAGR